MRQSGRCVGLDHSPEAGARTPIVLQFRRDLTLERVPAKLPVSVTADNRFVLYVNGERVASGPSTGTVEELAICGRSISRRISGAGRMKLRPSVWNFGDVAPAFQQMVATGFRLIGDPISTSSPGWRVRIDRGHTALSGKGADPLAVLRGERARGHRRAHGRRASGRTRCRRRPPQRAS